jgi:hypothetical protein
MAVQLEHVLACIRSRRRKEKGDAVIERLAGGASESGARRRPGGRLCAEDLRREPVQALAGNSDDPDPCSSLRGRDGRDHVGV